MNKYYIGLVINRINKIYIKIIINKKYTNTIIRIKDYKFEYYNKDLVLLKFFNNRFYIINKI